MTIHAATQTATGKDATSEGLIFAVLFIALPSFYHKSSPGRGLSILWEASSLPIVFWDFLWFRRDFFKSPLDKSLFCEYNTKAVCNSGRNMGV